MSPPSRNSTAGAQALSAALHPTPSTSHPPPCTLHLTPYNLHPTLYTLHPTPYTLHPTPCTLHPTPCTLHPTPHTLHPTPYILHPTPYTQGRRVVVAGLVGSKDSHSSHPHECGRRHESRRYSRDTYPVSCITEYPLIYEDHGGCARVRTRSIGCEDRVLDGPASG